MVLLDQAFLTPYIQHLLRFLKDESASATMEWVAPTEETSRLFFTNSDFRLNAFPILVASSLVIILLLPLINPFLLELAKILLKPMDEVGYRTPEDAYSPPSGYEALLSRQDETIAALQDQVAALYEDPEDELPSPARYEY